MNSYLSLTKTFISAISMSKTKDKRKRKLILILSLFALFGIIIPGALFLGLFVFSMTSDLISTPASTFALQLVLEIVAIFTFVFGISVVLNELYFSNDVEYILPWPLRMWHIVASKFSAVYIAENLMQILFVIASIVGFGFACNIGVVNWILGLLGFLFLPILPMVYCTVICMIIMRFTKIIKNKDIVQKLTIFIIFSILFFVMIFVGSVVNFDFNGFSGEISELGDKYFGFLNIIFPTINLYVKSIAFGNVFAFLGYFFINVLSIVVMLIIAEFIYYKGLIGLTFNNNFNSVSFNELVLKSRRKSVFYSYFMKEIRILMRTPTFYTNCIVSNFIWPIFIYAVFKALGDRISLKWIIYNYASNLNIQLFFIVFVIGISVFVTALNSISSNAISREGKHFHFMKGIPVSYKLQWHVKSLVGSLFAFIGVMVFFIPISIVLKLPFLHIIGYIILSVLSILFASYMGIYIDSIQPKLVWDDEMSVLRENYNMFFSMSLIIFFVIFVCVGGYLYFVNKGFNYSRLFVIFGILLLFFNFIIGIITSINLVKNIESQEEM